MVQTKPFLDGKRIYLRALVESDSFGPYLDWFNDELVCRGNSHHVFPFTREDALAYIREAADRKDALILAVVRREGDRHIGNVSLQSIHPIYRSAELAILVGDESVWGQGYGREAARLICDHGFSALNLYRIACGTLDTNEAMKKLAIYLGMREEGRRRQAAFKDGRHTDIVEFGVLRSEYLAKWNLYQPEAKNDE